MVHPCVDHDCHFSEKVEGSKLTADYNGSAQFRLSEIDEIYCYAAETVQRRQAPSNSRVHLRARGRKMTEVAAQQNGAAVPPSETGDVMVAMKEIKLSDGQESPAASIDDLKLPLSAADGLIKKPFAAPLATAEPTPRPALTTEQEKKYDDLLHRALTWTIFPTASAKGSSESPLTDIERLFLTRECLLRYLRATTWNVTQAETRLKATLVWRREYGVEKLTPDYIEIESRTGIFTSA